MFFLVLVVQLSDVLQYVWGKTIGQPPASRRRISPNKTWEGLDRRRRLRHRGRRRPLVGDAVLAGRGGADGARRHDDGIRRRPDHVGDQAGPRRQGLRRAHRRATAASSTASTRSASRRRCSSTSRGTSTCLSRPGCKADGREKAEGRRQNSISPFSLLPSAFCLLIVLEAAPAWMTGQVSRRPCPAPSARRACHPDRTGSADACG